MGKTVRELIREKGWDGDMSVVIRKGGTDYIFTIDYIRFSPWDDLLDEKVLYSTGNVIVIDTLSA